MTVAVASERSTPTPAPALDHQNPWPGLAAYDETSSGFFHGRAKEAAELMRLVRLAPLTVLYGKSGLGKSSLLQAGLFPRLRVEHFLPVRIELDFTEGAEWPLEQVRQRLSAELDERKVDHPAFERDETVWEYLHRKDLALWSEDNFPLTVVLVFDQFEELFSRGGGRPELVQHIFDNLADLIENRIPAALATKAAAARRARLDLFAQRYRVVLAFREDFLPQMKGWEPKVPSLLAHGLRIEPLSRAEAVDALERAGRDVLEPGVAPVIVDFVGREPDSAPGPANVTTEITVEPVLLSLCCARLNGRRRPGGRIGEELVNAEGRGILEGFYREALADGEVAGFPDVAAFIEEHLIQGDHFRGDYPKDEALAGGLITRRQLAALTGKHRLLRIAPHPDTMRIELIHDRLVPVVSVARAARKARQRAEEMERAAAQERERAEERERAAARLRWALRQTRTLAAVAVVVAIAAGGLLIRAVREWRRANEQSTASAFRAMASTALTQARFDPAMGVRLALRAAELSRGLDDVARAVALDTLSRATQADRLGLERPVCEQGAQLTVGADGTVVLVGCVSGVQHVLRWPSLEEASDSPATSSSFADAAVAAKAPRMVALDPERRTIRIFDLKAGELIQALEAPSTVRAVAISADGQRVAARGSATGWLWRLGDGRGEGARPITLRGHPNPSGVPFSLSSIAFDPAGAVVATGAEDGSIRLWNAGTGAALDGGLEGHMDEITSLEFGPDGRELVSASGDGTARVWVIGDRRTRIILDGHANSVFSAAFSADGRKIVSGGADSTVRIWDSESGRELARLPGHSPVIGVRFVDRDRRVVSASWDGVLRVWNATGPAGRVTGETFDDRGKLVATSSTDGSVRLWDVATGEELRVLPEDGAGRVPIRALAFAPGGARIACGDVDGRVRIWDLGTGATDPMILAGPKGTIIDLAFSPDGRALVSASRSGDVTLWDLAPPGGGGIGRPLLQGYGYGAEHVAISPDGAWIAATTAEGSLWLWGTRDLASRRKISAHDAVIFQLAFSPDSARVLTTSQDRFARVFDVESGKRVLDAEHSELVMDGVFASGGRNVVTSTLHGEILVWDVALGTKLEHPPAHGGNVTLAIDRDGRHLATFSWDRSVKVWDARTWRQIAAFSHQDLVDRGALSPDGSHLATYTRRDGIRIIPVDPEQVRQLAERRVSRHLTREECKEFGGGASCDDLAP